MSRLPQVAGERVVRALERAGLAVARQKGSHVLMKHPADPSRRCTVPVHGSKPVKPGTLNAILRGARVDVDEFLGLL